VALVTAIAFLLTAQPVLDLGVPKRPVEVVGGCPASARVEVNLPAWRAALEQAAGDKRRDDLLGEVKLELELPEAGDGEREPRVTLAGVEDAVVQLEPGERADHVLHVRYRYESGDAPTSTLHLVQVLRPLGGRAYCALGAGLSTPAESPAKLLGYAVTFVPLVSAKAKVIQVESVVGEARESETRRAYWAARGWRLHKIFDEALGHMESPEAGGAAKTTVATVALSGDFPKKIDLTVVTKRGGCEVRPGDNAPCEGGGAPATTTTFVYDGAKYVAKGGDGKK
jgi:hypothetical protein